MTLPLWSFSGDWTLNAWWLDEIILHWNLVADRLADRTAAGLPHFRPLIDLCAEIRPPRSKWIAHHIGAIEKIGVTVGTMGKTSPWLQEARAWIESHQEGHARNFHGFDGWLMTKFEEARPRNPSLDRFLKAVQERLFIKFPNREQTFSPQWHFGEWKQEVYRKLLHECSLRMDPKMSREEADVTTARGDSFGVRSKFADQFRKDQLQFLQDNLQPRYEPRFREWIAEFMTEQGAEFWPVLSRALERKDSDVFSLTELALLVFWDGMSWRFRERRDLAWAVPLKNWRDDCAHRFVHTVTGENTSLRTFQQRRRALGLLPPKESGERCLISEFGGKLASRVERLVSVP